jgi:hypothetical protein
MGHVAGNFTPAASIAGAAFSRFVHAAIQDRSRSRNRNRIVHYEINLREYRRGKENVERERAPYLEHRPVLITKRGRISTL